MSPNVFVFVFLHPASIDVNQVVPIRMTGKEGGSLTSRRKSPPPGIYQPGTVTDQSCGQVVQTQ